MVYQEQRGDFLVADICIYELGEKYDVVISLFYVMSYQTGNQDIMVAQKLLMKFIICGIFSTRTGVLFMGSGI